PTASRAWAGCPAAAPGGRRRSRYRPGRLPRPARPAAAAPPPGPGPAAAAAAARPGPAAGATPSSRPPPTAASTPRPTSPAPPQAGPAWPPAAARPGPAAGPPPCPRPRPSAGSPLVASHQSPLQCQPQPASLGLQPDHLLATRVAHVVEREQHGGPAPLSPQRHVERGGRRQPSVAGGNGRVEAATEVLQAQRQLGQIGRAHV